MAEGWVVALEGASGAGKTTVAESVGRAQGWTVIAEAYRRIVPTPSLEYGSPEELIRLETRLLEEDARRYREARAAAASGGVVLADTGFLGPLTYTWGLVEDGQTPFACLAALVDQARSLAGRSEWGSADLYLYLDTPREVRAERARATAGGLSPRVVERHQRVGELEREFYVGEFASEVEDSFQRVAADRSPEEVVRAVVDAVHASARHAPSPPSTEELLALFGGALPPSPRARGNR